MKYVQSERITNTRVINEYLQNVSGQAHPSMVYFNQTTTDFIQPLNSNDR